MKKEIFIEDESPSGVRLSVRCRNVLRAQDIWTAKELAMRSYRDLKKFPSIGSKSANEMRAWLKAFGLCLKGDEHLLDSSNSSSPDQFTEQAIQAAGANVAPRITPDDIAGNIASEFYFTGIDGASAQSATTVYKHYKNHKTRVDVPLSLLTFCVLVTTNGHTVTGESHCQDPAKFDAQIGREEARKDAINKLWPMVVYAARSTPAEWPAPTGRILTEADSLADLHGYARPDQPALAHHPV